MNRIMAETSGEGGVEQADAASVPLPDVSRSGIQRARESGALDAVAWTEALSYAGLLPGSREWSGYWRHILLLCGALFLVAGVMFFIAWNWNGMHRFARFVLVEGAVVGSGLLAVYLGMERFGGRVSLLVCGIAVGPMLAVFGQTYQTGAQLWELFRVWTAILVALALVGRQAALWLAAWLAGNVFVMLWLGRTMDSPLEAIGMFSTLPESVLALVSALAAWEYAAYATRGNERHVWLHSRWLPRILFADITIRLTSFLVQDIVSFHVMADGIQLFLERQPALTLLAVAVACGSWFWHRKRTPDLFMPACVLAAMGAVLVALLLRAEMFFSADVFGVFLWGMVIVGITTGIGMVLQRLQREMEGEGHAVTGAFSRISAFFMSSGLAVTWPDMWRHLQGKGLVAPETPLPVALFRRAPGSPWYVQAMLALGGWVAALLFLASVALFLFATLKIRSGEGEALLGASLCILGGSAYVLRGKGFFLRHFGLAVALAGAGGVIGGMGLIADFKTPWLICAALFLGLSVMAVSSPAYRFLAAAGAVALFPMELGGSIFSRLPVLPSVLAMLVAFAWWVLAAGAFVLLCLRENAWRGKQNLAAMVQPVLFGLFAGMACYMLCSFAFSSLLRLHFFSPGTGCALALVFMAWKLTGRTSASIACACVVLPLGWFLPGAALALLGLAAGRLLSDRVMQGAAGGLLFVDMVHYYYSLHIPLLHKSLLLAATGAALLVLALAWQHLPGVSGAKGEPEGCHA